MTKLSSSLMIILYALLPAILFESASANGDKLVELLNERSAQILAEVIKKEQEDTRKIYSNFAAAVADELAAAGDLARAARIRKALAEANGELPVEDLSAITHAFAREFYKDEIIAKTAELMKFKTYATEVPNRENPEFIRQKDFLAALSAELGLKFRDVDGYVQEITLGESERSLGVTVHSDVQPVDASAWEIDPWGGIIKDGALWGRGSIDDKGPLAVIMYAMRSLLDSGLPLNRRIVLMVGTDEESANEDMNYYLKTNPAPDQTIVVDAGFPVFCAEKGWCGSWLKLPGKKAPLTNAKGYLIVDLQAGFSQSIVPGKATAVLEARGIALTSAIASLQRLIERFHQARQGSKIDLTQKDGQITVTAYGRTVHSSVPETGHNALMDLLVFLDTYVKPLPNTIALMAKFAATNIGFELNGETLGIAHHDDFMGEVTVAANLFKTEQDSVLFMFNYRIPRGISLEKIRSELQKKFADFERSHNVKFAEKKYTSEPLYNDPNSPFVTRLLSIYNNLTGEELSARSMGGGTYAKRIPNAVCFGPNMPNDEYLGHQPNENIKLSALTKNIEILTHTLATFAFTDD